MERFKAVLLAERAGYERGTVVEVARGGEGFANRWLALAPLGLAGQWLLPFVDADFGITAKEALVALRLRAGRKVGRSTLWTWLRKGRIANAGFIPDTSGRGGGMWMMSREEVWTMQLPTPRGPPPQLKAVDPWNPMQTKKGE